LWPSWTGASPRLFSLASRALACAAGQPDESPEALARTLYEYNRLPAIPRRLAIWTGRSTVHDAVVGAIPRGSYTHAVTGAPGWLHWRGAGRGAVAGGRLKFYVSPHPDELRDALGSVVPALARHGSPSFKIASEAYGLLRPDKLVVYLDGDIDIESLARDLAKALAGCRAHGVPFSAPLAPSGIVSWGIDPPPVSGGRPSWRAWIATRLGDALAVERRRPAAARGAVEVALRRLARDGVNTRRWAPTPALAKSLLGGAA
jgi:hypothetical protein